MLKVTLLGTGSPEPRANRHGSAHLVEADGEYLLFDCGPGTTQRLAATDVPIVEIDYQCSSITTTTTATSTWRSSRWCAETTDTIV